LAVEADLGLALEIPTGLLDHFFGDRCFVAVAVKDRAFKATGRWKPGGWLGRLLVCGGHGALLECLLLVLLLFLGRVQASAV
jgi:hypothetical protein